ncbi:MAG TPA: chromosome segregation protein SMC, partial [Thermomonas sp.]|nr:chromosome segregation protein SMC [Thermomonas sp.]
ARALQAQLGDGESVISRNGERLGAGWVRVVRSGAAKQGALLREKEIQSLRGEIDGLVDRERELEALLTRLRDQLLAAEQQREDAQRALYLAHRGVSELAGQLQSQQGKLESARNRIERIDAELAQLASTLEAAQAQSREARQRVEHAVSAMGDLETARQALDAERRQLAEARDAARLAARESRDAAHALALTLESQRVQVVALAQALERMGGQRGQLDSRLGDLAAQLAEGDAPVQSLENERQVALTERVRSERELAEARSTLEGIDNDLRGFEQVRQQRDAQALAQREAIGQRRLDQQALAIKA